jgi:hypothetical protein
LAKDHGIPWREARRIVWKKNEENTMKGSDSNLDITKLLEDIKNDVKSLGDRISKLEDNPSPSAEVKDPQPESNAAALADQLMQENEQLKNKLAQVSSPGHDQDVIRKWLIGLDQENFITLGVKLGHLEEAEPESPESIQETELEDGGQKFILTHEKPGDMTGWAYSEALGMYARVK